MEPLPYVNGDMLRSNIGKSVVVIGRVEAMSPSMAEMDVQLADGKKVKVQLEDQLEEPLEGYIQMKATVNRDSSLVATHLVSFGAGEMDLEIYNQAVLAMQKHSNLFSSSEVEGMMQ